MTSQELPDISDDVAEHAPVMIWRADAHGRRNWLNRAWAPFVGASFEDATGDDGWEFLIHTADLDGYRKIATAAFEARAPFSVEYRLLRKDGVFRRVVDNGRPRFNDERFAGFVGSCTDVTEWRSTERSLRAAREERAILMREVHHRVKNNLQNLMALIRFMRRSADVAGCGLLDALNARLVSMAIVQRYLHASDNMTEVSVWTLLSSIVPQLAETDLGIALQLASSHVDLTLPAQAAAYTGLAVAEAIVLLMQSGAVKADVDLFETPERSVEVRGSAGGSEVICAPLGVQLLKQYARGAGARAELRENADGVTVAFQFPAL